MTYEQMWEWARPIIADHWPPAALSLLCLLFGTWWGRRQIMKRWRKRDFLTRINVSLNILEDGFLRIRTLLESDLHDVLISGFAVEGVKAAAKRTTEADPVLPLGKDDAWFYLNAVLNEVSERYSIGFLRRDMGQPVATARYLLCLTCECAGAVRTRKIRAMMIRKDALLSLPEEMPRIEAESHAVRFETLQILAKKYHDAPHDFLEVELCV